MFPVPSSGECRTCKGARAGCGNTRGIPGLKALAGKDFPGLV
jgi:hypothetical protein